MAGTVSDDPTMSRMDKTAIANGPRLSINATDSEREGDVLLRNSSLGLVNRRSLEGNISEANPHEPGMYGIYSDQAFFEIRLETRLFYISYKQLAMSYFSNEILRTRPSFRLI